MSSEIVRILDQCVDKEITIKLRNDSIVKGTLQTYDEHMNLVLVDCEDITDGKTTKINEIVLRGDNIIMASIPEKS